MDNESGFGVSHLSETPITVSFGLVLLGVLLLLIVLRLLFADVKVSGGGGVQ
jgi:hypothetical protein